MRQKDRHQPAAKAQGTGAVAVGIGARANGVGAMAQGQGAVALFDGSVAIGAGAQANADPTTAIGNNAIANGNNSVALGANTTANGHNSVALGQGSVANRDNTVSVGSDAQQRQITNVAAGVQAFDAVNVGQLGVAVGDAISQANTYAARGVAQTLAMPSIPSGLVAGRRWMGAAGATYGGQTAVGLAFAYQVNTQWNVGAGVSASTSSGANFGAKVQTGFEW